MPEVTPRSRRELGLPEDVFLGVTVGRVVARKALDRLITALARPETADVHLVVIGAGVSHEVMNPHDEPAEGILVMFGEGAERADLEVLAKELGIAQRVHFMGWVEEETKWQILGASDAFLSSTLHEGYGLVFLEAMAMELPVVAPDHGGHLDFLTDGVTGRIVPVDDIPALTEAIQSLERSMIYEVLKRNHWNKTRAAQELRISRRNLIRKVNKYKLDQRRAR